MTDARLKAPAAGSQTRSRTAPIYSGTAENPLYVDRVPATTGKARARVVMVHGGCHTGACYLGTPDGRDGWAQIFADHGYEVFVVDWPGHGRSPARTNLATLTTQAMAEAIGELLKEIGPAVLLVHSASGPMAWWLAERIPEQIAAIVGLAPGAPANILPVLPDDPEAVAALRDDVSLGCPVMLPEDGPVSVGEDFIRDFWANAPRFPMAAFDKYCRSIVPESARLFNERFNIGGRGLRVEDPADVAKVPALIVTGDHDPRHAREVDGKTASYVGAEFTWLPDHGISGNGHMAMIEDNNEVVAGLIVDWLRRRGL